MTCVQSMFARTCEPLVLGPAFAMDRMPGPVWVSLKFCARRTMYRSQA